MSEARLHCQSDGEKLSDTPVESIPVPGHLPRPDVAADSAEVPGWRGHGGGHHRARDQRGGSSGHHLLSQ